jgi:hypothetical protein
MNINLSKARRAEKMGLLKEADAYEQAAEKNKIDAYKAGTAARRAGLDSLARAATAAKPQLFRPAAPAKLSEQMEYLLASPADRAIMNQRYQQKAPGLAGTQTTATAMGERTDAQIAAEAAKQAAEIAEKRDAARLLLEKEVDASLTPMKLMEYPEYAKAMEYFGKTPPAGVLTPAQVREKIKKAEVERRAGARPSASGGGGAGGGTRLKFDANGQQIQ